MKRLKPAYTLALFLFISLFVCKTSRGQTRTYASSQYSEQIIGCGSCQILNPDGAVGSNHNDYSTIVINTSALGGSISQFLVFPQMQTAPVSKIVIGLGRGRGLALKLLGHISVMTYQGTATNGDFRIIDSTSISYQPDSVQATYTFLTNKKYDRVEITLDGGILSLGDSLRIYYAYNETPPPSFCGTPPANPYGYYPFELSLRDVSANPHDGVNNNIQYTDRGICQAGIADTSGVSRKFFVADRPSLPQEFTIAFWAKSITGKGNSKAAITFGHWEVVYERSEAFGKDSVTVIYTGDIPIYQRYPMAADPTSSQQRYHQYVFTYKNPIISYYKDGFLVSEAPLDITPYPVLFTGQNLTIRNAYLDDLVFYDRALTPTAIKAYWDSYNIPAMGAPVLPGAAFEKKAAGGTNTQALELFPNPTTGRINISGKPDPSGSTITLTDIFGKEVFRVTSASRTLNIPSSIPPGSYFISVYGRDGKIYRGKVILRRE